MITKQQLIEVAKAGYKISLIDEKEIEFEVVNGRGYLFYTIDGKKEMVLILWHYDNHVNLQTPKLFNKYFNHYLAIKKMEDLKLI